MYVCVILRDCVCARKNLSTNLDMQTDLFSEVRKDFRTPWFPTGVPQSLDEGGAMPNAQCPTSWWPGFTGCH